MNTKDIYLPELTTLISKKSLTEDETFYEFKLDSGRELTYGPGQFLEISLPGIGEAPISICSSPTQAGIFQLVVRKVGNVTTALSKLEPGGKVGVRGPFGTKFPVDDAMKGKDILLVCGGIGLVPVRSAINYILDNRQDYGRLTILYGVKTPADRLFVDELASWQTLPGVTVLETVDRDAEGWHGHVGLITTLLPKADLNPEHSVAVVCGPPVMYRFVLAELDKLGMKDDSIYVSLERRMKCGVGKCGHCQMNAVYVCRKGPVFSYSEIKEIMEAI